MEPVLGCVLLAAGSSRRMGAGRLKQLLPLNGRPVLRHCLETLQAAGLDEIVVVLAKGVDAGGALAGLRVAIARNDKPGSDMAESVRAGIGAIPAAATGVLVCLADHPLVSADTVRKLAAAHRARPDAVLLPVFGGKRGHPALFPASLIGEVLAGRTLREVREAHRERIEECPVEDDGVIFDMDTWEDYQEACARAGCGPPDSAGLPARRPCMTLQRGEGRR